MDYNKVFELGPWPMNLLLYIFEEDDWDVLKRNSLLIIMELWSICS